MSQENFGIEKTGQTDRQYVRYPYFLNTSEAPHRLHPLLEVVLQIFYMCTNVVLCWVLFIVLTQSHILPFHVFVIIPVTIVLVRLVMRNTRITLSDECVSFPFTFAQSLNWRLERTWSDIELADLHRGTFKSNLLEGNILTIKFKSGGYANIDLTRIPQEDLRALETKLRDKTSLNALSPACAELSSRNEFEVSDSSMYVFSTMRRNYSSREFGLSNAPPLPEGERLFSDQYTIKRVLASGACKSAYLAVSSMYKCRVRLTVYDLGVIPLENRQTAERELCARASQYRNLHVPGVLDLLDFRSEESMFYTVMEPGHPSLRSHVDTYLALSEKKTLALALQLAEILNRMRAIRADLRFFSIRPDTIIYKLDGTVMVSEFGFVDDVLLRYSNMLFVDAPFLAPELLQMSLDDATHNISVAADLYSIGATMYFALGEQDPEPYATSSIDSIRPNVSRSTAQLINRLMAGDPKQRGTLSNLIYDLGGLASGLLETVDV